MKIFTGYFAKILEYEKENCFCISIAGKCPEWYSGVEYKKLAPKYSFFQKWKNGYINNEEYIKCFYENVLDNLNAKKVWEEIKHLTGNSKRVILLCYEKPTDFCHRHIVANWLHDELNKTVKEFWCVEK